MKYQRQAIAFLDFANGGWAQQYAASLEDGTPTDIVMSFSKADPKSPETKRFARGDIEYPTLTAAFKAWFADNGREYPEEPTDAPNV
jgi:hypothetical protein